jgi:hypothetical protein
MLSVANSFCNNKNRQNAKCTLDVIFSAGTGTGTGTGNNNNNNNMNGRSLSAFAHLDLGAIRLGLIVGWLL